MEKFLYKRNYHKDPKINAWFAFPAIESFALSSLGYLSIFKKIDLMDDVCVERIYADTKTTQISLKDVDVIGFSNSFEIDILTIIKMFKKYSIPPKAKDRDENFPLIFAGGPVQTANPLPYCDFYDFICLGDGEDCFNQVFETLTKSRDKSRAEILDELSTKPGVWVPQLKKDKKIEVCTDRLHEPVYTPILSEKSYFKNTFIIEVERGCPKMCNFCLASWLNFPTRFVDTNKIIEAIDFGLKHTDKIALLGAYVAGHPDFDKIMSYICKKNQSSPLELSISSLRADLADENVIKTLVQCGQKTATIAIEAGSQRLRDLINKDLTDDQIFQTVRTARENGLKGLKMYVMIGHPGETQEDIEEIVNLLSKLKNENKGFDLTLSLSTFIPKAQTPFQWCKREDSKSLEKKIAYLKKAMHKIGVTFRPTSVDWDAVQSILSRYGDSLADYLLDVVENGGNLGAFKQTWRIYEKDGKLPPFDKAAACPIENNDCLAWDFICAAPKDKLKERFNSCNLE